MDFMRVIYQSGWSSPPRRELRRKYCTLHSCVTVISTSTVRTGSSFEAHLQSNHFARAPCNTPLSRRPRNTPHRGDRRGRRRTTISIYLDDDGCQDARRQAPSVLHERVVLPLRPPRHPGFGAPRRAPDVRVDRGAGMGEAEGDGRCLADRTRELVPLQGEEEAKKKKKKKKKKKTGKGKAGGRMACRGSRRQSRLLHRQPHHHHTSYISEGTQYCITNLNSTLYKLWYRVVFRIMRFFITHH